MTWRWAHGAGLAIAVALLCLPAMAHAQLGDSEATTMAIAPTSTEVAFPVTQFEAGAERQGTAKWTKVIGTGNCCEHYLAATSDGTLVDFGGNYPNVTKDRGKSWHSVRPLAPFVGGEGAIAPAPGGDIVGVGWDPYSGDRLIAFKYVAATGKWLHRVMLMHSPFFDREWISVVPGPWTIDGKSVPYLTFVRGGWPSKENWLMSTDGLNYQDASSTFADATLSETVIGNLAVSAGHDLDWLQAHVGMGVTPLGGGRALAAPDEVLDSWTVLDRDTRKWRRFQMAGRLLAGSYQSDSGGRVHQVLPSDSGLEYRMTADGGTTWTAASLPLPAGFTLEEYDFRAVHALGIAVVAVHASKDDVVDQDFVFKLAITGTSPLLLRRYEVGLGDAPVGSSLASTGDRFDFASVALLPDGRVATSYFDSTTNGIPGLAIEQKSDLPVPAGQPPALEPGGSDPKPPGPGGSPTPDPSTSPTPDASTSPTPDASTSPTPDPTATRTPDSQQQQQQQQPRGSTSEQSAGSSTTAAQDTFSFTKPAVDPGRFTVTLTIRKRRASGSVGVARAGIVVRIQRRVGRRWRTIARTSTDSRGRYSVAVRVRRGTRLRAVVAGTPERPGDSSPPARA